jgi:hypothetical protein
MPNPTPQVNVDKTPLVRTDSAPKEHWATFWLSNQVEHTKPPIFTLKNP